MVQYQQQMLVQTITTIILISVSLLMIMVLPYTINQLLMLTPHIPQMAFYKRPTPLDLTVFPILITCDCIVPS